jgi:formamidopyrimidine-DNA glycosylase
MPEALEIEMYRRSAERALSRSIVGIVANDSWYLKNVDANELRAALVGAEFTSARRKGKLLLLDVGLSDRDSRATVGVLGVLGLRFGMTGRLVVDGRSSIAELLYSATRAPDDTTFDRFAVMFADGGGFAISDPRRLGGVEWNPDVDRLGPDALSVSLPDLRSALHGGINPLKARLLDQQRVAGIGNLLADEILWRAKLSPLRPSGALSAALSLRLHREILAVTAELLERGGSHLGDFMEARSVGGHCPRCGGSVRHDTVGGRSTYWCPREQR